MTNPKTVAEFFAQYAEKGHLFNQSNPVKVVLKNGQLDTLYGIFSQKYTDRNKSPERAVKGGWHSWSLEGVEAFGRNDFDIVSIPSAGIDERGSDD